MATIEILVTDAKLDPNPVSPPPTSGAVVTFSGAVRGVTDERGVEHLEYEAYGDLAEKQLRGLAEEAAAKWGLDAVHIAHRTGTLDVGELSVVVSVTAPHRAEAFEACRYLIDTLKETAAIWKKEVFSDGSAAWVEHA